MTRNLKAEAVDLDQDLQGLLELIKSSTRSDTIRKYIDTLEGLIYAYTDAMVQAYLEDIKNNLKGE